MRGTLRVGCGMDVRAKIGGERDHRWQSSPCRLRIPDTTVNQQIFLAMYPFDRLANYIHTSFQNALIDILASGPVPSHIAFVMDGNRRYARMHQKDVKEGHSDGFIALQRVRSYYCITSIDMLTVNFVKILEICLKLGVRCVSVYAFAIENFKRPQDEVAALMRLAEIKLVEMCEHGYVLIVIYF